MPLLQVDVADLPPGPIEAASRFYATCPEILDDADALPDHDLVLVFASAGHEHGAWRLAAVQQLARDLAPRRVNALAGGNETAVVAAMRYLDAAPGVTGQLFALDGNGAGEVLYSAG